MPNKIWAILGIFLAVSAIIGSLISYDHWRSKQSYKQGYDTCSKDNVLAVNEAVEKDREEEKLKQEKVNEIVKQQMDKERAVNAQLNRDLAKLHDRAKRTNNKQQTGKSKSSCTGSTGADLSVADAKFLTRFAARADRTRIGLKACYEYADSIED